MVPFSKIRIVAALITFLGMCWILFVMGRQVRCIVKTFKRDAEQTRMYTPVNVTFSQKDLTRKYIFDETGNDVLVNLRIQKTSSATFNKHLWYDLDFDDSCTCKTKSCKCLRNIRKKVLFSSEAHKWPCGAHPDWTLLQECVGEVMDKRLGVNHNRRFFFLTMLRHPVDRHISEYLHIRRAGGWIKSPLICNRKQATEEEVPKCYEKETTKNLTLSDFLDCHSSLANNRMSRMLANLSLVNCYNRSGLTSTERNNIILESAKENLKNLAYFGIMEYQILSQVLFEHTFKLKFMTNFENKVRTRVSGVTISPSQLRKIQQLNTYDMQLYRYALHLFQKRLEQIK